MIFSKLWPFKSKGVEKSVGGTWSGIGWSGAGWSPNWFQKGDKVASGTALQSTAVYTCVSIISQAISKLKIKHYSDRDLKGRSLQYKSDIAKLLNKPNPYQNRIDFFTFILMNLLLDGNAYAFAIRDSKGKILSLHPLNAKTVSVHVTADSEVWYSISSSNQLLPDEHEFIPASEILHLRLFTPVHPLIGVSPLVAASLSVEAGMNIQDQSNTFFANKSKIGGYLSTPNKMDPKKSKELGDAWNEGTNGLAAGKTAVLNNDLNFHSFTLSAVDAEVIAQYKLSVTDIASIYHIPYYLVNPEAPHNFETAEAVSRAFTSQSLSFYIEYIEAGLDAFFDFDGTTEYVEFDVEAGISRGDLKSRMDAYSTGVHGGVLSPNDTRTYENLPSKAGGDDLFLQMQDRPLSGIEAEYKLKNDKTDSEIGKLDAETGKIECETKTCENPPEPDPLALPDPTSDQDESKFLEYAVKNNMFALDAPQIIEAPNGS